MAKLQPDDFDFAEDEGLAPISQYHIGPADRYSASKLYAATANFLSSTGWESAGAQNSNDANSRLVFTKNTSQGTQIITRPATDRPKGNHSFDLAADGIEKDACSISQALKDGMDAAKGKSEPITISVKVAQEGRMFKMFGFEFGPKRNHWTHLAVTIDGNKVNAVHTDSKGQLARLYNLNEIRAEVKKTFPSRDITFTTKYTGKQGIMDNTNCGRYAAAYEQYACSDSKDNEALKKLKADPLKYANEVMKLDDKCNTYENELKTRQAVQATDRQAVQATDKRVHIDKPKEAQHVSTVVSGPQPTPISKTQPFISGRE